MLFERLDCSVGATSSKPATEKLTLFSDIGNCLYAVWLDVFLICPNYWLEKLLEIASIEASPFRYHLRQHLWSLQQHPELATAFYQVVTMNAPVQLKSTEAFKLQASS